MMRLTDNEIMQTAMSSNIFAKVKDDQIVGGLKGTHYVAYVPDNYEKTFRDFGEGLHALDKVLRFTYVNGSYEQRHKAIECRKLVVKKINQKAEW